MANQFVEVERKHRTLSESYHQGRLDAEQFAQALAVLEFQDDQEQWWQIQGNGKWLRYNGEVWEEASPPRPAPPPPPRAALIPPPRHSTPIQEPDDSIFFQTGLPADQIPGLNDPEPAPGAFLLEEAPRACTEAQPLPIQVRAQALVSTPSRPEATPSMPQTPSAPPATTRAEASSSCPKCRKDSPPGAKFCKHCGSPSTHSDPATGPEEIQACPACHQSLRSDARFCGHCGHSLVTPSTCSQCHVPVVAGAHFCKNCGTRLT